MVVGTWLLAALVVDSAYRSSLVAHLTVQASYAPINSYEDLLNAPEWSWGMPNFTGSNYVYFARATNKALMEIYKRSMVS